MTSYTLPDGRTVSDSMAFTLNGIQYPSNWLRLSTSEDLSRLNITELAPPPYYDQRYYWGPGQPKDLATLKELAKFQQKQYAQAALSPSDWAVIRSIENPGKPVSNTMKNYRASIRTTSDTREAAIDAATTVEELIEAINTLPSWPTL